MVATPFDLNQVRIASPCTADWDAMEGDERVRFCGQCSKHVYNLSAMSQTEAQRVIVEHQGHLCVRFYQRSDGTMLVGDCPVGLRAWRRKLAGWLTATAAAVATLVTIGGVFARGNTGSGPLERFTTWVEPPPAARPSVGRPATAAMGGMTCPPSVSLAPPPGQPVAAPPEGSSPPAG